MRFRVKVAVCVPISTLGTTLAPMAHAGDEARQQMAFADETVAVVQSSAARVRTSFVTARRERDVVRTQCLDEKLTQLEATLRSAQDARATMRRASLREDMDAMAQAATLLRSLKDRAGQLAAAADQCIGEEAAIVSAQVTTVEAGIHRSTGARDSSESFDADFRTAGGAGDSVAYISPAKDEAPPARLRMEQISAGPAAPTPAAPPPSVPFAPTPAPGASPYTADATHEASMLAYAADVTLAVYQVDQGLGAVESLAGQLGGYLAQRTDTQVTIRVPRPRFGEAMDRIARLGDVLHRSVSAEDVTDEFVDLDLRLKNARALRDQLAELLKGAAVKDAVEIEKELAKVTEVIEQIEGRLKVLRDRVGFSTITVSFQASAPQPVRSSAILPFAFLDTMGLAPLLDVPKGSR
jgi:hypothetical protein